MSATTSTYPYDTIVYITDEIGGVEYQASGVLIAPDEVLTATHVVFQSGTGTATGIEVSAGYEDGSTPFGTVAGVSFHYNTLDDSDDQISSDASQSDFAVIHLAQPIPTTGTMELGDNFTGGSAMVSGYPANADGTQIDRAENLHVDPEYALLDGTALGPGSSGGPVWIEGANGTPEIVGIVSSGSGRLGYFVQLTAADVAEIDSWVVDDNGTSTSTSSGMTSVAGAETVSGPGGSVVTLKFPTATATFAGVLLGQISADVVAGVVAGETATPGAAAPTLASGVYGELVISQAQSIAVSPPYKAVVDNSTAATSISLTSGANISVAASGAALTLVTGTTTGTLVGGADGTLFIDPAGGGAWDVALGGGANTVVASAGNDTISAGAGGNLIFLGAGASSVASAGTDTIVGGAGAETISTAANNALVFAGASALTFVAGASVSTIVGGAAGSTVAGGVGATLFIGAGASSYLGGGAADTVLGGAGSLTGNGAGGRVLMFGGAQGGNLLTTGGGSSTLIGGGAGDVLTAAGNAFDVLAAGGGAETLDGSAASGPNIFFGGGGADLIEGGAGGDAIVAGTGADTLSGGGGVNAFIFDNAGGGASDVVTDFSAFRDFIELPGLTSGQIAAVEQSQTATAGGVQIALPDGTHVTFTGVSLLNSFSFT